MAKSRKASPAAKTALNLEQARRLEHGAVLRLHAKHIIADMVFGSLTDRHVRLRVANMADAPMSFQGFYDYYTDWTLFDCGLAPDENEAWSPNFLTLRDQACGCVKVPGG